MPSTTSAETCTAPASGRSACNARRPPRTAVRHPGAARGAVVGWCCSTTLGVTERRRRIHRRRRLLRDLRLPDHRHAARDAANRTGVGALPSTPPQRTAAAPRRPWSSRSRVGGLRWLFAAEQPVAPHGLDALATLLYVQNWRLAGRPTDYLAQTRGPVAVPALLVPRRGGAVLPGVAAAPAAHLAGRPRPAPPGRGAARGAVPASFAAGVLVTNASAPWAYFGSFTRPGNWVPAPSSRWAPAGWNAVRRTRGPPDLARPGLRHAGRGPVRRRDAFPGYPALLPVAGAVLVLAGGCAPTLYGAGRLLGRRPLVWLGGLSYGSYLWHWPLLVLAPAALAVPAERPACSSRSAVRGGAGLAWPTLRLVENPVRFHRTFRRRPRRALVLGAALTAGAWALS